MRNIQHGTLQSNIELNAKREQCNAVTLRNGSDFEDAFQKLEQEKKQVQDQCRMVKVSEVSNSDDFRKQGDVEHQSMPLHHVETSS